VADEHDRQPGMVGTKPLVDLVEVVDHDLDVVEVGSWSLGITVTKWPGAETTAAPWASRWCSATWW
jgi:hypothetical protein